MFFGGILSFVIFGGIAYFLSKVCLTAGLEKDNKFLSLLFYFLGPMLGLSLISCVVVALYSLAGVSLAAASEGILQAFSVESSGFVFLIGSALAVILGLAAVAAGPASAFTASQIPAVVAAIVLFAVKDEEVAQKWLPVVAGISYGFFMWPFAALLTFGL